MKRKLLILVVCLVFAFAPLTALAANQSAARVIDDAGMFTQAEVSQLTSRIWDFIYETGNDFVLVTVPTTGGMSTESYAKLFYEQHTEYDDSSVILVICMDPNNREWFTLAAGNCSAHFTNEVNNIVDNAMQQLMIDGKYAEGINAYLNAYEGTYGSGLPEEEEKTPLGVIGGLAAALGLIPASISKTSAKSGMKLRNGASVSTYANYGANIRNKREFFLYSEVAKTAKPQQKSTHVENRPTARGTSYSGGGRKF